jgi:transcriptional regulator with XRE-family HTH domain
MMRPMPELAGLIGARLRELRLDAELSQRDVAKLMSSNRNIVSRLERGVHVPSMESVQRYAEALELDLETVLAPVDRSLLALAQIV